MSTNKIIFDCERMKYPFTGLYSFCYHLGMALKEQSNNSISYYLPQSEKHVFGLDAKVVIQNSLHKFILPNLSDFQIWHSTFQGTNYFPAKRKLKKVLTVHDLNFLYDDKKNEDKKKRQLRKLQSKINQSDAIVAISNFVLDDLKQYFDLRSKQTQVIYNGCNFNSSSKAQEPNQKPNSPFLFTIGTITEKKNFHVLPAILKNYDGILIISGITQSEHYFQKIIQEAKRHHVENKLIFTGPISEAEKQWYMQNAEAFLFPSLAEGFGLPVVEAMFSGKPVILSKKTSLPEIGGDVAFYFDNFEPEHMQAVLHECLNQSSNNQLEEKIKNRASMFNWKDAADSYLNIYKNLQQ